MFNPMNPMAEDGLVAEMLQAASDHLFNRYAHSARPGPWGRCENFVGLLLVSFLVVGSAFIKRIVGILRWLGACD